LYSLTIYRICKNRI